MVVYIPKTLVPAVIKFLRTLKGQDKTAASALLTKLREGA